MNIDLAVADPERALEVARTTAADRESCDHRIGGCRDHDVSTPSVDERLRPAGADDLHSSRNMQLCLMVDARCYIHFVSWAAVCKCRRNSRIPVGHAQNATGEC